MTRLWRRVLAAAVLAALALTLTWTAGRGAGPASAQSTPVTTITTFATGNNNQPTLWSDGTTLYVNDWPGNQIFAYNLSDGAHNSAKTFATSDLDANQRDNTGIWGNDTTLWLADYQDNMLYAYTLSTKARDSGKDITLHTDNANPRGIWSDGTTIWVMDDIDDKLYAYTLSTKARDSSKEITLSDADEPADIWSDGETVWVGDEGESEVRAYSLSDGTHDINRSITSATRSDDTRATLSSVTIGGIWSDGEGIWIANVGTDITRYHLPLKEVTGIAATATAGDRIRVTWDRSDRGEGYLVQWKQSDEDWPDGGDRIPGREAEISGLGATSHTFTVDCGRVVSYDVRVRVEESFGDAEVESVFATHVTASSRFIDREVDVSFNSRGAYSGNGEWIAGCGPTGVSKYYSFTLTERREVHVAISSSDTVREEVGPRDDPEFITVPKFTPLLYLREGEATTGTDDLLAQSPNTAAPDVYKVLDAGTYTVEATNLEPDQTGRFSIAIDTRALTAPPATTGDSPASCETVSLTAAGTYTGEWGPGPADSDGACDAEGASSDGYARFYEFHLARETRVTISLESGHATPRLSLRWKRHPHWQARAGRHNEDRRLSPHVTGTYSNGGQRISETLYPGSYTIQAASNEAGQRGEFTLKLQGSGIGPVPELPDLALCADAPASPTLTEGTEATGQWGPGCESGTTYQRNFARFYNFSVTERKSVTVTLKDTDNPNSNYGFILRGGGPRTATVETTATIDGYVDKTQERLTSEYISLVTADNDQRGGLWSDGTTLWTTDWIDDKLYAYSITSRAHDSAKDISVHSDNDTPSGVWSDGTTIWVTDWSDNKLYAYELDDSNGNGTRNERIPGKDVTLHAQNTHPYGIWSDGETIWVVDNIDINVYAYELDDSNGNGTRNERIPGKEIAMTEADIGAIGARGLWADGETMWVSSTQRPRIVGYDMQTRQKTGKSIFVGTHADEPTDQGLTNADVRGIWSDGKTKMYLVSNTSNRIAVYSYRDAGAVSRTFVMAVPPILGGAFNENNQASRTIDLQRGEYWIEAWGGQPSEFTIKYDTANPSSASNCHGRSVSPESQVEGRWFNDCASSVSGKYAAYHDLDVPAGQAGMFYLRLRSFDSSAELRLWNASDFTGSGASRTLNSRATPVASAGGQFGNSALNVDLQRGRYVVEAITGSVNRLGKFRLGATTGEDPDAPPPRENCGEVTYDEGVVEFGWSGTYLSTASTRRTANQNNSNHADYLRFGYHSGDEIFKLGQNDVNACTGNYRDGFPVWHFVFTVEDWANVSLATHRNGERTVAGPLSSADTTTTSEVPPPHTLRKIGGHRRGYRDDGTPIADVPLDRYFFADIDKAPDWAVIPCAEEQEDGTPAVVPPCGPTSGDSGVYSGLSPGTYAVTVSFDPASDSDAAPVAGAFSIVISVTDGMPPSGYQPIDPNRIPLFTEIPVEPEQPNRVPEIDGDTIVALKSLTIEENSPAGTKVGLPVTFTDPDGDTLTYSLSGTDAASFSIDPATGQITTVAGATYDYDTKKSYSLRVTADDGRGRRIITSATVNLTDVDEPPVFDDGESTTREVAENSPAGTKVGEPVTATDPEGAELSYVGMDGRDAKYFNLDAKTGQLTTKDGVTYDYDTRSSYGDVLVVVQEQGTTYGYLSAIRVTVNLTKAEETDNANGEGSDQDPANGEGSDQGQQQQQEPANRAPDFDTGIVTTLSVDENSGGGVNVGSPITATDPDEGDTVSYSLSGTDASSFEIGASTGQITTKTGVTYDYETDSSYSLTVEASDGELSVSTPVTINLNDVGTAVVACTTTVGSLTATQEYAGKWDKADCTAHHQSGRARYFQFTLTAETRVTVSLTAGTLYVSKDTPRNGWGTVPGPGYEHRKNVRKGNGKLVHDGDNTVTLSLAAGTYTVEAAAATGSFTLNITPD